MVPFVSVAANDIPYGTTLYISQLDGLDLGENQRYNGCIREDDTSWSFDCNKNDIQTLLFTQIVFDSMSNRFLYTDYL